MRATGICNTAVRAATMITPLFVVALLSLHGIGGAPSMIIGRVLVQIIAVSLFGIESRKNAISKR